MNPQFRSILVPACIALIALCLFVPFLGGIPLFDWDEVNFAEAAREMILTGNYTRVFIDFVPFWEKPPLFFWLQATSMHVWGINDFAARFPNAICGVLTLVVLYWLGKKLYDRHFGLLWVFAYAGSILPHLYFRSGIIDPWFNLFIFLAVAIISLNITARRNAWTLIPAGILLGLAVLAKGPVAYLIIGLVVGVYLILKRFRSKFTIVHFTIFSAVVLITCGVWYGAEVIQNGPWFVTEFIRYQIELFIKPGAGHAGFPGYHVIVLLFGCFPASIFAIRAIFHNAEIDSRASDFRLWMILVLAVVLVLFTVVQSKIVHYSSLCYFPLTFFATAYVWRRMKQGFPVGRWQSAVIASIGMLFVLAGVLLVYVGSHPEVIHRHFMLDQNAVASLNLTIDWQWWHILPVVFLSCGIIAFYVLRRQTLKSVLALYTCTALFVSAGIYCWVGKVQQYTQGPSTEFFASLRGQDVYAVTWGHKSFSPYWDFRKPLPEGFSPNFKTPDETPFARYSDAEVLLNSPDLDKDVYVLTKAAKADAFENRFPDVERIGEKGGFVYFKRSVR